MREEYRVRVGTRVVLKTKRLSTAISTAEVQVRKYPASLITVINANGDVLWHSE